MVFEQGDIMRATKQHSMLLDAAIVNPANARLEPGGGLCGVIHNQGGPIIADECRRFNGVKSGMALTTTAGRLAQSLNVSKVIHACGPDYRGPATHEEKVQVLRNTYKSIMEEAERNGIGHVFVPGISTGIYRFPKQEAAEVAVQETGAWLEEHDMPQQVTFCDTDVEYVGLLRKAYCKWVHTVPFAPLQQETKQRSVAFDVNPEVEDRTSPFFGHTPLQRQ